MSVRQRDKRLTGSHRFSLSDLAIMEAEANQERMMLDKSCGLRRCESVKVAGCEIVITVMTIWQSDTGHSQIF